VQCDDPDKDEVTKLLEGDNKEEEAEEGQEGEFIFRTGPVIIIVLSSSFVL
jgi:hypothetical protein